MYRKNFLSRFLTIVALLFVFQTSASAEEDFLLPDQAFKISGSTLSPDSVEIQWDIAEGYYLYRSKFSFQSETDDIELGTPEFPKAKKKLDEIFGDVEVYYNKVKVKVPLNRNGDIPDTLTLKTKSQGCAEQGICYPPHEQTVSLKLAALAPVTAPISQNATLIQPKGGLAALANLSQNFGLVDDEEILTAEEAYLFSATVDKPNQLKLYWQIAEGTYLYKDKVQLTLKNAQDVSLGDIQLPKAKLKKDSILPDGSIGDIEVYYKQLEVVVPLNRRNTDASEIELVAKFQGCADLGICYPPVTKKTTLKLPGISTAQLAAVSPAANIVSSAEVNSAPTQDQAAPDEFVAEHDQLANILAAGNTWIIIASFFGAGLLLAFTPCVFPMIPILSGIIAGQGENITTRKAFTLSLVYVLSMAVTYTIAGVLAGLFGENLQILFQNPWVLSFFAIVFALLALSMFGFFELQLPSSLQSRLTTFSNKQEGGTLIGVSIMGFLSALIVGPCLAPPLAAALIVIGQTGDGFLGGTALFFLAMGMGAPLIVIGTSAGKLLPRAGAWMDAVKAVFGVGMLVISLLMLERIVPPAIAMILWGALLIGSAIYMGALRNLPEDTSGWSKLWKGLGLVLLIYGGLMLVGAAAGGKDTVQPLRGLGFAAGQGSSQQHLSFKRIKTVRDLKQEIAAASSAGKPVMLDIYADWCTYCIQFEKYVFPEPGVTKALSDFVLLQADITENDEQDQALMAHLGVPAPPSLFFFGSDGKERKNYRILGYMEAEKFASHVTKAVAQ